MDEVPFVPPCKRQLPKAQEDDAEKIAYYLYYALIHFRCDPRKEVLEWAASIHHLFC